MKNETRYRISQVDRKDLDFMGQPAVRQILEAQGKIPEFEKPYGGEKYCERLKEQYGNSLTLITSYSNKPIGFLISYTSDYRIYELEGRKSLYLWMGGVAPGHRNNGLMSSMIAITEWWAGQRHYETLSLKTYPKFEAMLSIVERQGFVLDKDRWQGDALFYSKTIDKERSAPDFQDSLAYKKCRPEWDLDLCWIVQDIVNDRISSVELEVGCGIIGSDYVRIYLESGKDFDFLQTYRINSLAAGDQVEYGLNRNGKLAFVWHPGIPCHFKRVSEPNEPQKE